MNEIIDYDKAFIKIIHFFDKENSDSKMIWRDTKGYTEFIIDNNIVNASFLGKHNIKKTVIFKSSITDVIDLAINENTENNNLSSFNRVISIGSSFEHNLAKELIYEHKSRLDDIKYLCIPFPLSNDSFCTNRSKSQCNDINVPSRETIFPASIIIDLSLLKQINQRYNLFGIGEFIGLYYSIMDFFSIRSQLPLKRMLEFIEKQATILLKTKSFDNDDFLVNLAKSLILKCLVMRIAESNAIGAGGDHLIAYLIERDYCRNLDLSHGEMVLLGSMFMAGLYPEWNKGIFSLESLYKYGNKIGLINDDNIIFLLANFDINFIKMAISTRPNRESILSQLTEKRINSCKYRINKLLRGNSDGK